MISKLGYCSIFYLGLIAFQYQQTQLEKQHQLVKNTEKLSHS